MNQVISDVLENSSCISFRAVSAGRQRAGAKDPKIKKLKSTTFFGKRLTRRRIADVQEAVAGSPELSRRKLGHRVCELLGWVTPKGNNRACLRLLEHLEEHGILSLPPVNASKRRGPQRPIVRTERGEPQPSIEEGLSEPLALQVVTEEIDEWNELVDRYPLSTPKCNTVPRDFFAAAMAVREFGSVTLRAAPYRPVFAPRRPNVERLCRRAA